MFILSNIDSIYYVPDVNLSYDEKYNSMFFISEYDVENEMVITNPLFDVVQLHESCLNDFDLYIGDSKLDEKYLTGTIPVFRIDKAVIFRIKSPSIPRKLRLHVFSLSDNLKEFFTGKEITNMQGLDFYNIVK